MSAVEVSDGPGSAVEHEPHLVVGWIEVSKTDPVSWSPLQSQLVAVVLLAGSGLDQELHIIAEWVFRVEWLSLVDGPGLVELSMALPGAQVLVVHITSSNHVHAVACLVSDLVSSLAWHPSPLLVLVVVRSGDQVVVASNLELVSSSVGDSVVYSVSLSDSGGSGIEGEVLVLLKLQGISHSQDVLVSSNVLSNLNSSSGSHASLDLEMDFVAPWVVWLQVSLLQDIPELVGSSVTSPGAETNVDATIVANDVYAFAGWVSELTSSASFHHVLPLLVRLVVPS